MKTYSSNLPNFDIKTMDKTLEESVKSRELAEALAEESKFIRENAEILLAEHAKTRTLIIWGIVFAVVNIGANAFAIADDKGYIDLLLGMLK